MRSYAIARFLYGMISTACWLVMIFGGIIAVAGIIYLIELNPLRRPELDLTVFLGSLPGVFICLLAFFGLVFVQNARTSVDIAECTQQVLKATRDHMELSRQALTQGQNLERSLTRLAQVAGSASPTLGSGDFATVATQTATEATVRSSGAPSGKPALSTQGSASAQIPDRAAETAPLALDRADPGLAPVPLRADTAGRNGRIGLAGVTRDDR